MYYVYGPVPSRRLGRSLGVDPIPPKTCNFSCVYCQLGRTTAFTNARQDFFPPNIILQQVIQRVDQIGKDNIDYITFVGDGEPTLCRSLGWLIEQVKSTTLLSVAVITNGALLYRAEVREQLMNADVVLPTLDAGTSKTFKRINRPHPTINFQKMVEGMSIFREMYHGQLWIEIMVIKGINDQQSELEQIKHYLGQIKADRVYINVPVRPPAESWVKPPSQEGLARVRASLGDVIEIILPETGDFRIISQDIPSIKQELIQIIKRHPMRLEQIKKLLQQNQITNPEDLMTDLEKKGYINHMEYQNQVYFFSTELKMKK